MAKISQNKIGKKKFYGCTGSLVPGSQFQRLARGQAVLRRLALWASFGLSCLRQWLALWASLGLSCIETVDPVGLLSWWGRLFSGQPRVADVCGHRGHGRAVSSLAQDCSGCQGVSLGRHCLDSFKSCPGQCVRHMVPAGGAGRTCYPVLRVGPLFDGQFVSWPGVRVAARCQDDV